MKVRVLCWSLTFLPVLANAASSALVPASSGYALNLPYLEYGSGTGKLAFSATLTTSNFTSYTLGAGSVKSLPPLTAANSAATLSNGGGTWQLAIPYLEYRSGGATKAYSATLTSSDLSRFDVTLSTVKEVAVQAAEAGPGNVAVVNVDEKTVGSSKFASSSKLRVNWSAPSSYTPSSYKITATEALMGTSVTIIAGDGETSITLSDLKASTTYSVTVQACTDAACFGGGVSSPVNGKTSDEFWQFQGSGNSVSGLTKVVSDGNARIAVMRYGSDAPSGLSNRLQLYYGPGGAGAKTSGGLATALSSAAADAAVSSSYLSFSSAAGSSGLLNPSPSAVLVNQVMTGQAVPLSATKGGYVRIYFETAGADNKTRILSIDSRDGYVGKDFSAGSSAVCQTTSDYSSGGGCEPSVVIGLDGDAVNSNSKVSNARQFKIGYPTLSDWRWDESIGTYMLFTLDQISGCTTYSHNQGYAVWDGSRWNVQYESSGCPKLMKSMQAATPLHLGGVRYKLYFGDPSVTEGRVTGSKLPFLGPKKLLYGDGASSGNAVLVDYEDWEATTNARAVRFLWPSGDEMSSAAYGYIDDFMAVTPTANLDFQVLYVAITDGTVVPFSAAALLLNP